MSAAACAAAVAAPSEGGRSRQTSPQSGGGEVLRSTLLDFSLAAVRGKTLEPEVDTVLTSPGDERLGPTPLPPPAATRKRRGACAGERRRKDDGGEAASSSSAEAAGEKGTKSAALARRDAGGE